MQLGKDDDSMVGGVKAPLVLVVGWKSFAYFVVRAGWFIGTQRATNHFVGSIVDQLIDGSALLAVCACDQS